MKQIGIIGSAGTEEYPKGGKPSNKIFQAAERLGELIALNNTVLITGGKGGIMESAAKGAKKKGGISVGIVKGDKLGTCNKYVDIEIASNTKGEGEEAMLISSCDAIIVVGGGAGTLQELAAAYRKAKPIVAISTVDGVSKMFAGKYLDKRKTVRIGSAKSAKEAIEKIFKLIEAHEK